MKETTLKGHLSPAKFKVGDYVVPIETVMFTNGEKHIKGKRYMVRKETEAYFHVCQDNYNKVNGA